MPAMHDLPFVRQLARRVVPTRARLLYRRLYETSSQYHRVSFAQEGEDIILGRILQWPERGFYVDIGAHHPQRFSNTYTFYLSRWSGIAVDASPGFAELFRRVRPRDVVLEAIVTDDPGPHTLTVFDEPALNTIMPDQRQRLVARGERVVEEVRRRGVPLADILDQHLPPGQAIDFLSVDVEGADLAALRSSDWTRYRPKLVCCEAHDLSLTDVAGSPLVQQMRQWGYEPVAKTFKSVIFVEP